MSTFHRVLHGAAFIGNGVVAWNVAPALWAVGPVETFLVFLCMAFMSLELLEVALTGESTANSQREEN